jgi:Flp pilus assembly protein CpaB
MWKVKRMNRARIVVLTIAIGVGGAAAYHASGSGLMAAIQPHGMRAVPIGISPQTGAGGFILPSDRVDVSLLAVRGIAKINPVEVVVDDRSRRRDSIDVVRSGVTDPTTIQT